MTTPSKTPSPRQLAEIEWIRQMESTPLPEVPLEPMQIGGKFTADLEAFIGPEPFRPANETDAGPGDLLAMRGKTEAVLVVAQLPSVLIVLLNDGIHSITGNPYVRVINRA